MISEYIVKIISVLYNLEKSTYLPLWTFYIGGNSTLTHFILFLGVSVVIIGG